MATSRRLKRIDSKGDKTMIATTAREPEDDGLRAYIRTVSDSPPLERDEELRHATALAEARENLARLFRELPKGCREYALNGHAGEPDPWPLETLETVYKRVNEFVAANRDSRVNLVPIRRHKRQLDRARDALIHANLRFVPFVVRQLGLFGTHFMDLIQEGNIGLMMAVDRFDPKRGHRFATYAFWWIRQAITRALTESFHLVKFSAYTRERLRTMKKVGQELENDLGRRPTPEEIAERMNLPAKKIRDLIVASQTPRSLESPDRSDREPHVLGIVADSSTPSPLEDTLIRERRERVMAALDRLSPRERQVIRLRYGIGFDNGRTLREIGQILRVSRERVRQIETEALAKIQELHESRTEPTRRPRRCLVR